MNTVRDRQADESDRCRPFVTDEPPNSTDAHGGARPGERKKEQKAEDPSVCELLQRNAVRLGHARGVLPVALAGDLERVRPDPERHLPGEHVPRLRPPAQAAAREGPDTTRVVHDLRARGSDLVPGLRDRVSDYNHERDQPDSNARAEPDQEATADSPAGLVLEPASGADHYRDGGHYPADDHQGAEERAVRDAVRVPLARVHERRARERPPADERCGRDRRDQEEPALDALARESEPDRADDECGGEPRARERQEQRQRRRVAE